MKPRLLTDIKNQLLQLGLAVEPSEEADLEIHQTFIKKRFLGGQYHIYYDLLIGINSKDEKVYVIEKISSKKSGITADVEVSSTIQSGRQVYRKVKTTAYGLDGLAHEHTLNLGDIIKAIKKIAKNQGYGFKFVLRKDKILEAKYT
ncbi:MAG: hypothetical protein WC152_00615 [Candidatus Izemoplasmatales bacterium]